MIVDSSVWLEILFDGKLASACVRELAKGRILIPSLVLFEVYKKTKLKTDESRALEAVGAISSHEILELTREVALLAADLSIEHRMGMADSIVLAHARHLGTRLITLDHDFAMIPDVSVLR